MLKNVMKAGLRLDASHSSAAAAIRLPSCSTRTFREYGTLRHRPDPCPVYAISPSQGQRLSRSTTTLYPRRSVVANIAPFDLAWSPTLDAASLAPGIFAASLFPYLAFLYYLTKAGKEVPRLTLFGFYFLLVFVGATIPAGIYAKLHYGTSLANVDWLHGTAESLLTITNLLIVLGLRQGIREAAAAKKAVVVVDAAKKEELP